MIVSTTEEKKCPYIQVMSTNYTILLFYITLEVALESVLDLTS